MQLHERIRNFAKYKDISLTQLAKSLGIAQQTLNQWLKPGSQKNIYEHLPRLLELFPDLSRDWIWFGEGDMLGAPARGNRDELAAENTNLKAQLAKAQAKVERLEQQLEAERNLSHELTRRLMLAGVVGSDGGTEQKFPKAGQG